LIVYSLGYPTPYAYGSCPISGHGRIVYFFIVLMHDSILIYFQTHDFYCLRIQKKLI
jgi:hypothetical protein